MLPRSINIGPFTFHFYGLIIAAAIFLGWYLAKKRANLYGIPQKIFDEPIILTPLFLGIIGARLYHVIDYWSLYASNLLSIIYLWQGGLGILGGLAGAILGFAIVAKVKKVDLMSGLDLAAPSMLLGQAVGRVANFVNQEGFGPPTENPWGVFIAPENRPINFSQQSHFHPTFFYEAIIDAIFLVVLFRLSSRFKKPGQVFALYLILYSVGRFTIEFWRIDTAMIWSIKVAHVLSVIIFVVGIWLFAKPKSKET